MSYVFEVRYRDGEVARMVAQDIDFAAKMATEGFITTADVASIVAIEGWVHVCPDIHSLHDWNYLEGSTLMQLPDCIFDPLNKLGMLLVGDLSKAKWETLQKLFPDDPKKVVVLREYIAANRIRMKDPAYYDGYCNPYQEDEDQDDEET